MDWTERLRQKYSVLLGWAFFDQLPCLPHSTNLGNRSICKSARRSRAVMYGLTLMQQLSWHSQKPNWACSEGHLEGCSENFRVRAEHCNRSSNAETKMIKIVSKSLIITCFTLKASFNNLKNIGHLLRWLQLTTLSSDGFFSWFENLAALTVNFLVNSPLPGYDTWFSSFTF